MRRQRDYIYQRPDSRNWYLRLETPKHVARPPLGKHRFQMCLDTDRREIAEIKAAPYIQKHKVFMAKQAMLARLQGGTALTVSHGRRYEPGLHSTEDGGRVFASETELHFLDHDSKVIRREPNATVLTFAVPELGLPSKELMLLKEDMEPAKPIVGDVLHRFEFADAGNSKTPKPRTAYSADEALLEAYIAHKRLAKHNAEEARQTFALYTEIVGKPFNKATRADGRKLADHLLKQGGPKGEGNKSATVEKKIGWLRAAVNMAIDDGTMSFNAFEKVVPSLDDSLPKLSLSEEDMDAARAHLDELSENDGLLWRLLASMGLRLSEAFRVEEEFREKQADGSFIRYIQVGLTEQPDGRRRAKSDGSKRKVPIPTNLLPYLPGKIAGKLFSGSHRKAGDRLNRFIRKHVTKDERKTLHCLRHRAADRLRDGGASDEMRYSLLGHGSGVEIKHEGPRYGEGFSMRMKLKNLNKVGW